MEFWNEINLLVPPLTTYSAPRKKFDATTFKKLFENAVIYYGNTTEFDCELKQLSQFLFLAFNQMRMMKGCQEMKKTLQVAERMRRLDIVGILEAFNSYVSDGFQSQIQLPYRQNLDYVLIRLQGLSKILIRLVTCSRKSAKYMLGLIRAGSFYIKGTLYTSSLAKIWDTGREMCKYTVNLYDALMAFRKKIKAIENLNWVADNCCLPENLGEWLGEEFRSMVANETYDFKMLTKQVDIEKFIDNRTNIFQLFENYKHDDDDEPEDPMQTESTNDVEFKIEPKEEIEDYTPIARNLKVDTSSDYSHSLDSITSKERVKLFLKLEDKYRKVDESKSLTIKKVKKKDWKEMKRDLSNKLLLMQESALLEYVSDYLNDYLKL